MTGILDRLEKGGWIVRERDPADRRAVLVRAVRDRYAQLLRLYSGLSRSMNKLLAGYSDTELDADRRLHAPHRRCRTKSNRRPRPGLTHRNTPPAHDPRDIGTIEMSPYVERNIWRPMVRRELCCADPRAGSLTAVGRAVAVVGV